MTAGAAIVAAILLPIVYLLWGLPVHLAMQKIGISSVAMYSVAGALPGAVFVTVFKPFGLDSLSGLVAQSMFCSFIGTTGAIVLWYYQVYKNA